MGRSTGLRSCLSQCGSPMVRCKPLRDRDISLPYYAQRCGHTQARVTPQPEAETFITHFRNSGLRSAVVTQQPNTQLPGGSAVTNFQQRFASCLCAVIAVVLLCTGALNASAGALSADDIAQLAAGGAVIHVAPAEGAADGDITAAIDIPAPRASVWRVLYDCDRAASVMPNLTSCSVLQSGPGNAWDVREHRIRWISLLPEIRSQFRSDYVVNTSITFTRTGGDMRALEGSWHLEPLQGGAATRLRYEARVGFGALIPGFVVCATSATPINPGSREALPASILKPGRALPKASPSSMGKP